jgi:NADH:ubiquinone oxidoreductase subunit 2 (subunit N)
VHHCGHLADGMTMAGITATVRRGEGLVAYTGVSHMGFVLCHYLTRAAGGAALWLLLIVMMVTSGMGLFYYLRVIAAMLMQPEANASVAGGAPVPFVAGLRLTALTIGLVWLGVYPAPLIRLIRIDVDLVLTHTEIVKPR